MYKFLSIFIVLIPLKGFGFFDSALMEAKSVGAGMAASTAILDEFAEVYDDESTLNGLYELSLKNNKDIRKINEKYNLAQSGYELLKSSSETSNPFRFASGSIRKYSQLIKILCSWGIEACEVATSVAQIQEQRRTNEIIMSEYRRRREMDLKQDIRKLEETKETIGFYKNIESIPENMIKGMNKRFGR